MKYRVKIRVVKPDGSSQKIAFEIAEQASFVVGTQLAAFAPLARDGEKTFLKLMVHNHALWAVVPDGKKTITVNGTRGKKFRLQQNDQIRAGDGSIEFMEIPVFAPPENEAKTQFITTGEDGAIVEDPGPAVDSDIPEVAETAAPVPAAAAAVAAPEPVAAAASSIVVTKPASAQVASTASATNDFSAPDSATGIILRASVVVESASKLIMRGADEGRAAAKGTNFRDPGLWQDLAISVAMIAISAESASAFAMRCFYESSPIHAGIPTAIWLAICLVFSALMYVGRPLFSAKGRFLQYFRTASIASLMLIPWSFSFGFPKSVIVFSSLLAAAIAVTTFVIRFSIRVERFVPAATFGALTMIFFGTKAFAALFNAYPTLADKAKGAPVAPPVVAQAQPAGIDAIKDAPPAQVPPAVQAQPPQTNAPVAQVPLAPQQVVAVNQVQAPVAPPRAPVENLDPFAKEQFFNAINEGRLDLVRKLVEKRAVDPIFTLLEGSTALHYAAKSGRYSIVQYLISKKVDVNAKDPSGTTALMWAVYRRHTDIVELLVGHRAKLDLRRDDGESAFDIAKRTRNTRLIQLVDPRVSKYVTSTKADHSKRSPAQINKKKSKKKKKKKKPRRISDDQ